MAAQPCQRKSGLQSYQIKYDRHTCMNACQYSLVVVLHCRLPHNAIYICHRWGLIEVSTLQVLCEMIWLKYADD